MLNETKRDLTFMARKLVKPYEDYSIDELADAYCDAVDNGNEALKDIYISALVLRFWHKIDKMYKSNTVVPSLEHEDFFWWLYEAIEYACKYRGWRDADKNLNAQQCINQCIETIKLQKYYNFRLDKNKTINFTVSMDAPINGDSDDNATTVGDMLEAEETWDDHSVDDVMLLVQNYINRDKIVEAILIDNIAFNDVQRWYKKTIKTETGKYTEISSEFWAYQLVKLVSRLSEEYKLDFLHKYRISEEKLDAVLSYIAKSNNQRIYKLLSKTLEDLRVSYVH